MGLDNPLHILLLLLVVLLVFGARRLPEIGRSLGDGMRGFKDSIQGHADHSANLDHPLPAPVPTTALTATRITTVHAAPVDPARAGR